MVAEGTIDLSPKKYLLKGVKVNIFFTVFIIIPPLAEATWIRYVLAVSFFTLGL